jgi:hypothetical protein
VGFPAQIVNKILALIAIEQKVELLAIENGIQLNQGFSACNRFCEEQSFQQSLVWRLDAYHAKAMPRGHGFFCASDE